MYGPLDTVVVFGNPYHFCKSCPLLFFLLALAVNVLNPAPVILANFA